MPNPDDLPADGDDSVLELSDGEGGADDERDDDPEARDA